MQAAVEGNLKHKQLREEHKHMRGAWLTSMTGLDFRPTGFKG